MYLPLPANLPEIFRELFVCANWPWPGRTSIQLNQDDCKAVADTVIDLASQRDRLQVEVEKSLGNGLLSDIVQKCHALISASPGCEAKVATACLDVRVAKLIEQNERQAKMIREDSPFTPSDTCVAAFREEISELRERLRQSGELHDKIVAGQKETIDGLRSEVGAKQKYIEHLSAVLHNERNDRNAHMEAACRERDSAQTQLAVARANYDAAQADAERYWKLILDTAAALGKTIPGDMLDLPGWVMHLKGELIQTQKEVQRLREANGVLVEAQKTCDPVLQHTLKELVQRQAADIAYLRRSNAALLNALSQFL